MEILQEFNSLLCRWWREALQRPLGPGPCSLLGTALDVCEAT